MRAVPTDGEGSFDGMADDPAGTAASNNPLLSTLVAAVTAAGLGDTLNSAGPFTIFAPVNSAFDKIPTADLDTVLADTDLLTSILTYHVVPEQLSSADLVDAGTFTTVNGAELSRRGRRHPESTAARPPSLRRRPDGQRHGVPHRHRAHAAGLSPTPISGRDGEGSHDPSPAARGTGTLFAVGEDGAVGAAAGWRAGAVTVSRRCGTCWTDRRGRACDVRSGSASAGPTLGPVTDGPGVQRRRPDRSRKETPLNSTQSRREVGECCGQLGRRAEVEVAAEGEGGGVDPFGAEPHQYVSGHRVRHATSSSLSPW